MFLTVLCMERSETKLSDLLGYTKSCPGPRGLQRNALPPHYSTKYKQTADRDGKERKTRDERLFPVRSFNVTRTLRVAPERYGRHAPSSPLHSPASRGSGDYLRLPGLAGHLGATLRDDQRARRGLAVQTEAADHVLQRRAFRLPLLHTHKERERERQSDVLLWRLLLAVINGRGVTCWLLLIPPHLVLLQSRN